MLKNNHPVHNYTFTTFFYENNEAENEQKNKNKIRTT